MSVIKKAGKRRVIAGATAVVGLAAGATAFAVAGTANAADSASGKWAKPTVVLEHGAFADGSSWNGVVEKLHKDGYNVVAAANPLRGVASDAAQLRTVIDHVNGPVILVGHSYGGSVITEAAANNPKVKGLVYVAAFLPAPGESALQLTNQFPGSTLPGALDPVTYTNADGSSTTDLYIQQDKFHHQFAADVSEKVAADAAAAQRPIAQAALTEAEVGPAAWAQVPSWDVVTTQDLNIPVAAQRFMAERAGAQVTEVKASHSVAVSHPGVVAGVIEEAARATR
ncbi:MAG: alpha/beta hydrolase [Catenulispora sp.]|nr:alpha/beta hydrolase [Catenulispora sp.]